MIKEPTVPRYSQQLRDQQQHSSCDSFQMLPEPPLPACPEKFRSKTVPDEPVRNITVSLSQGRSTLAAYIQVAESQHEETAPDEQEQFVDAVIRGLRDKRAKKKCETKLKGAKKTWNNLKNCFPVASQQCQRSSDTRRLRDQGDMREETLMERRRRRDSSILPPAKGGIHAHEIASEEAEGGGKEPRPMLTLKKGAHQVKQINRRKARNDPAPEIQEAEREPLIEHVKPGPPRATKRTALNNQKTDETDGIAKERRPGGRDHQQGKRAALPTTPPPVVKKRALDKQDHSEAGPAAKKNRINRTKPRRQERPPSIPILASSEDEFSRGGRK